MVSLHLLSMAANRRITFLPDRNRLEEHHEKKKKRCSACGSALGRMYESNALWDEVPLSTIRKGEERSRRLSLVLELNEAEGCAGQNYRISKTSRTRRYYQKSHFFRLVRIEKSSVFLQFLGL